METNITLLPDVYTSIQDDELYRRIQLAKDKLGTKLLILGHHYQVDDVIKFADDRGDSLALAQKASKAKIAEYIVFCGVHFMAESADILTSKQQKIILPDMGAGCSMADMASIEDLEDAWEEIKSVTKDTIIPITYINSSASIKAFCGLHDGVVCTSSNADKIIKWALSKGDKVMFLPDRNLGKNTAYKMGIDTNNMITWDYNSVLGGNEEEAIRKAIVILWNGYCNVHEAFNLSHVRQRREEDEDIKILVHPECSFELVNEADFVGSTSYIINTIDNAEEGSKWAIGTEVNLVNRLKKSYPNLVIKSLSPYQCLCATMFRISPPYLLNVLDKLLNNTVINQITVDDDIAHYSRISLDRMLSLS